MQSLWQQFGQEEVEVVAGDNTVCGCDRGVVASQQASHTRPYLPPLRVQFYYHLFLFVLAIGSFDNLFSPPLSFCYISVCVCIFVRVCADNFPPCPSLLVFIFFNRSHSFFWCLCEGCPACVLGWLFLCWWCLVVLQFDSNQKLPSNWFFINEICLASHY